MSPNSLDKLEFLSPIAKVNIWDRTVKEVAIIFDQVWQRRLSSLWDFLAPMNDIGNVVKYAGLPMKPLVGQRAWISDSTVNTWGTVAAGGGANQVGVVWSGTSWNVFAK